MIWPTDSVWALELLLWTWTWVFGPALGVVATLAVIAAITGSPSGKGRR